MFRNIKKEKVLNSETFSNSKSILYIETQKKLNKRMGCNMMYYGKALERVKEAADNGAVFTRDYVRRDMFANPVDVYDRYD